MIGSEKTTLVTRVVLLTLGAHAQKCCGTCLVCVCVSVSVCVCVCLSVCYHSSANIARLYAMNKVCRGLS